MVLRFTSPSGSRSGSSTISPMGGGPKLPDDEVGVRFARASDPPYVEDELDAAFARVIDDADPSAVDPPGTDDAPARAADPTPDDAPRVDDASARGADDAPMTAAVASADDADAPGDAATPTNADDAAPARRIARNVHERLRGLNLNEQIKVAQTGETHERIVLERLYGKTVWEALLRNPRLTGPEVARIARMAALPKVLLELILGNGTWLHIPEVRRALLASKRLGTDQIVKVLRFLPKHELKLATMQTAYPPAVRDAARRLLRGEP